MSLMPLSMCEGLFRRNEIQHHLPLVVDHFVKYPIGVLEDVSIRVGDLYMPVDFVMLEIEEDTCTLITLGRPFLAIAGCHIDVKNDKLSFDVWGDHVEFNMFKASKFPSISESGIALM